MGAFEHGNPLANDLRFGFATLTQNRPPTMNGNDHIRQSPIASRSRRSCFSVVDLEEEGDIYVRTMVPREDGEEWILRRHPPLTLK